MIYKFCLKSTAEVYRNIRSHISRKKTPDLIIKMNLIIADLTDLFFGKLRGIQYKDDKVYKNFDYSSRIFDFEIGIMTWKAKLQKSNEMQIANFVLFFTCKF